MLFLSTALAIISFKPSPKTIVGHWRITYKSGTIATVDFMADGSFLTKIPSENFAVGGKYKLSKSVLSISDTSCNADYWGTYKIAFHGNDSIYSEVIADTCSGRKAAAHKVTLVRYK